MEYTAANAWVRHYRVHVLQGEFPRRGRLPHHQHAVFRICSCPCNRAAARLNKNSGVEALWVGAPTETPNLRSAALWPEGHLVPAKQVCSMNIAIKVRVRLAGRAGYEQAVMMHDETRVPLVGDVIKISNLAQPISARVTETCPPICRNSIVTYSVYASQIEEVTTIS